MMQKLKGTSIASHATRKRASSNEIRKKTRSPGAKPDCDRRLHERGSLEIPVHLQIQGKESSGMTHDLSPAGLRVISDTQLSLATPMAMQFNFGGETCYIQVSGQVVYCRKLGNDKDVNYETGIKFCGDS